jgi:hypothetical protein
MEFNECEFLIDLFSPTFQAAKMSGFIVKWHIVLRHHRGQVGVHLVSSWKKRNCLAIKNEKSDQKNTKIAGKYH